MPFEDLAFLFTSDRANRGTIRMDFDEAAALYKAAKSATNVVEIGRLSGGSAILMASAMEGGRLLSIDMAPPPRGLAAQIAELASSVVVTLITSVARLVPTIGDIDLLLIDGDHTYEGAKADFTRWGPCVRVGGVIVFHDMALARPNATQEGDLARFRRKVTRDPSLALIQEVGSLSFFRKEK